MNRKTFSPKTSVFCLRMYPIFSCIIRFSFFACSPVRARPFALYISPWAVYRSTCSQNAFPNLYLKYQSDITIDQIWNEHLRILWSASRTFQILTEAVFCTWKSTKFRNRFENVSLGLAYLFYPFSLVYSNLIPAEFFLELRSYANELRIKFHGLMQRWRSRQQYHTLLKPK